MLFLRIIIPKGYCLFFVMVDITTEYLLWWVIFLVCTMITIVIVTVLSKLLCWFYMRYLVHYRSWFDHSYHCLCSGFLYSLSPKSVCGMEWFNISNRRESSNTVYSQEITVETLSTFYKVIGKRDVYFWFSLFIRLSRLMTLVQFV